MRHRMTTQQLRAGEVNNMDMSDLERMKLTLDIYHGLRELAPEDIEKWRTVCLAMCSPDDGAQDFINMAADMALKPECMKK